MAKHLSRLLLKCTYTALWNSARPSSLKSTAVTSICIHDPSFLFWAFYVSSLGQQSLFPGLRQTDIDILCHKRQNIILINLFWITLSWSVCRYERLRSLHTFVNVLIIIVQLKAHYLLMYSSMGSWWLQVHPKPAAFFWGNLIIHYYSSFGLFSLMKFLLIWSLNNIGSTWILLTIMFHASIVFPFSWYFAIILKIVHFFYDFTEIW